MVSKLVGQEQNRVLIQYRTGANGDIKCMGFDLLAPQELAVEIDRRQHGRAKEDINAAAVASRRRGGLYAAQFSQEPGARTDLDVPQLLAVPLLKYALDTHRN